jgi:hypothetical protein
MATIDLAAAAMRVFMLPPLITGCGLDEPQAEPTLWLTKIRLVKADDYSSGPKRFIKPSCTGNKLVISAS